MGTNWFMPALVNSRLGLSGMRLEDGTMVCCFNLKKSRNDWRICVLVIMVIGTTKERRNKGRRLCLNELNFVVLFLCCSAKSGGRLAPNRQSRRVGSFALSPERNKVGARLCAKHQPQHVEKLCGTRHIPAGWLCEAAAAGPALRDTAALRGQIPNASAPGFDGIASEWFLANAGAWPSICQHRQLGPGSQTTFHAATIGHPQNCVPQ